MACVALSAALFLSSTGCQTGAERAGEYRGQVEVGMTRDEVEERLGEPDGWQENVGGFEVWAYAYRPSVGTFVVWRTVDVVKLAALIGLVFGLFWITRGLLPRGVDHGPSLPSGPSKDERFQRFVFRIGFEPAMGRVAYISSPFPE